MTATPTQGDRLDYLRALLSKTIEDYRLGRSDLRVLTRDLESLLGELERSAECHLTNDLREEWVDIETIHALALDEGRHITEDEKTEVMQSIANIERLVGGCPATRRRDRPHSR